MNTKINITKKYLKEEYINKDRSMRDIAKELDTSHSVVGKYINRIKNVY